MPFLTTPCRKTSALVLVLLGVMAPWGRSADFFFNQTNNGDFASPANWQGGTLPGGFGNTFIGSSALGAPALGSATASLNTDVTSLATGRLFLGQGSSGNGTLNLNAGASLQYGEVYIGRDAGATGALNQSGGTNRVNTGVFEILSGGASGTYQLSGGTLTTIHGGPMSISVGASGPGTGYFLMSGGALHAGSAPHQHSLNVGWGARGEANFSGGTANLTGDLNAGNHGNGLVTVSGSATVNSRAVHVGLNAGGTNSRLTVSGGTLAASNGISVANSSTLVVSGGTLTANGLSIASGSVMRDSGGSLNLPSITNNGSIVYSNSSGTLTRSNAISGSGTLTKLGAGNLTLTGLNTYTGTTTISGGTLNLGTTASLRFLVGPAGVNTRVEGSGALTIDGTFMLDLSSAATTPGASWPLVTAASTTFGPTFAVAGFTESPAGTWSLQTNGVTYRFVESSRTLSVVFVPPYDRWVQGHSLDPWGSGGPEADPDGDGWTNFHEYALGGNLVTPGSFPLTVAGEGGNFVLEWLQRTDDSVTYTLQECTDLATGSWAASPATVGPASGSAPPAGYQRMRMAVPATSRKFYRVQAAMPPRQAISFGSLPVKTAGLPSFTLAGTTTSGLPITYTSSNPDVATITGNTVTIVGAGTATIRASQPGNGSYGAAADVLQTLTVAPKTSLAVDAKTDFGAVGDGMADDTAPLQAALDYLSTNLVTDGGACLVLPSGTYKITRRLNFTKASGPSGFNQGVTIRGAESEGSNATIIDAASTNGALFFSINDTEGHYHHFGVRVQDLQIRAGVANAGTAIEIQRSPAIDDVQSVVPLIKNVSITTNAAAQSFRYGIIGRKVLLPEFTDVRVTGVRGSMEAGIFLERNYSFTVNNCRLAGANTGIDALQGGEGNDIMHTTITDVNTGINMHVDTVDFTGPSSLGGALYGCDISAYVDGVIIDHKGYFPINDNRFTSLGTASSYRHLTLKKVHHVIVTENTFTGPSNQTGVRLEDPYCWENTVAYNNFGSLNTAVRVVSGVSNTTILDNLPASAPVLGSGSPTYVRRDAPRAKKETATRTPVYGYQTGRVLVPWSQMADGPVIKVTDYGANGLDAADDTAAIQSAVNALQASLNAGGQGTLYFPAGLYRLSSRLDLNQGGANWQKVTICGDGAHVSGIVVTGTQGVFKIDCTQPVPIFMHGLRIDPHTSNPSTAIEITQQNGAVNGNRSLLMQDVRLFTWGTRYFTGGIKGTGVVRPLLQNVDMRSVGNDTYSSFGIHFTGGYGFDWQGGNIYGKQNGGVIESLGGAVNIRGPRFAGGGLTSLTVNANGGSFSLNGAHMDAPRSLLVSNANHAVIMNTLTISGPQNPDPPTGTTLEFRNCTDLHVRDNILAAAYQTPRPSNVFVQLGPTSQPCNGFDISGNMMLFNNGEGTGIHIPAQNLNGSVYDNRFFGNPVEDIVNNEPTTDVSLLPNN